MKQFAKLLVWMGILGILFVTTVFGQEELFQRGINGDNPSFQQQIHMWIDDLSKQKGFEHFKKARWEVSPLGPGTDSLLVLLTLDDREIGYFIVSATPDGKWMLSEYGTGQYPPFSPSMLKQSLQIYLHEPPTSVRQSERIYLDPFHAVWKLTFADGKTTILDGVTGEILPLEADDLVKNKKAPPLSELSLQSGAPLEMMESLQFSTFDPYESIHWLTDNPLPLKSAEEIAAYLKKHGKLTYAGQLFEGKILSPFAVIGFHQWVNGPLYLAVDHQGLRWIPVGFFTENGAFFP